jgi:hypothetical protein
MPGLKCRPDSFDEGVHTPTTRPSP